MREAYLGQETRARGLRGLIRGAFGNSKHMWMWDESSMEEELRTAGFVNIRRAFFGDAANEAFRQVDEHSRWHNCLGMECQRP
jgi:hypothetical protein